ncbi:hypothetical protein C482_05046 [Natrialba chahannaoensis JCM 10990]|uniref:Uncharacterized protein n=1 Tax=Natrialba chahannaoensis JCM 10990 TaxID=1227492 RepID=M0AWG9_9EURY|nr:hypothetical protein [Natrialba chahannaoensis]ELZ02996.1 hypothetical protein C482_05046 [Natrialba chahannaoensis JCM 10990]
MSDRDETPLQRLFRAERQFHAMVPIRDIYSKLFFRTLLWFVFFTVVYSMVTGSL